MINKMPEVGKRYKSQKGYSRGLVDVLFVDKDFVTYDIMGYANGYLVSGTMEIKSFLEIFEELPNPEQKSIEKPVDKLEVAKEELKKQIEWNDYIIDEKRYSEEEFTKAYRKKLNDTTKKAQNLLDILAIETNSIDSRIHQNLRIKSLDDQNRQEKPVSCIAEQASKCKNCNKEFRHNHRYDYFCSNYCIVENCNGKKQEETKKEIEEECPLECAAE